uniref:Uncharacterized protein n=1 Tax=Vitis vinifera TaxID=29760 RepID=F6HR48_VITVI
MGVYQLISEGIAGYLRLVAEKIEDKQSKLTTSSNGHGHGHLFEVLPWI